MDPDCSVSPGVITVKIEGSERTALDSRQLNDSCIKIRPPMPIMEGLLKQVSMEITENRSKPLIIAKVFLDYAYGQIELAKTPDDTAYSQKEEESYTTKLSEHAGQAESLGTNCSGY